MVVTNAFCSPVENVALCSVTCMDCAVAKFAHIAMAIIRIESFMVFNFKVYDEKFPGRSKISNYIQFKMISCHPEYLQYQWYISAPLQTDSSLKKPTGLF